MSKLFEPKNLFTPNLMKAMFKDNKAAGTATDALMGKPAAPVPTIAAAPTPAPVTGYTDDDPRKKSLGVLRKAGAADTVLTAPGAAYAGSKLG